MSEEENAQQLESYLKDHYAGGVAALELIKHSIETHRGTSLAAFFEELHAEVKADHEQLHNLMTALGFDASGVRNAGAWMAEKLSRAKIGFSGGKGNELGLLQALEGLSIGITGKRLLWGALRTVQKSLPILQQTDFELLEKRATEQLDRVEAERLAAAETALRSS